MKLTLRPLERKDLILVHDIDNERQTMAFWFREPYKSLDELTNLYDKHIHDDMERRFVIDLDAKFAGIIELDRKSTRLNSSHSGESRMPSSA